MAVWQLKVGLRSLRSAIGKRPELKKPLRATLDAVGRTHYSAARRFPLLIAPHPRQLTIAVTAHCNLRCAGCGYGRTFMEGNQLSLETLLSVLEDASRAGVTTVRLYGGEPLLHPQLPEVIRRAVDLGMTAYITTNGILLGQKIDRLYSAGLRLATVGFYGTEGAYDQHTQRGPNFARLERSLSRVRERYGTEFELQLNFVLMRPSCNLTAVRQAWDFARRFGMYFHIDTLSYSLPFFSNDVPNCEHFRSEDRPALNVIVDGLLELKRLEPDRLLHSEAYIRSIPDWLVLRQEMRVPCDAYQMLWIGADGTVQLCDAALRLGNVNEQPLSQILFGKAHRDAARAAFHLDCPNCTCRGESRIRKHAPSYKRYSLNCPD